MQNLRNMVFVVLEEKFSKVKAACIHPHIQKNGAYSVTDDHFIVM